jgi:phosphohistidine phosphatase
MNRLWLLRHAKAAPQEGDGPDRDRPLAPAGEAAAEAVAGWMAAHRLVPDLALCSSALRTRQTLALILPRLGGRPQIQYEDALYLADARELLARLRRLPRDRAGVLLVGHNPGLHDLAVALAESATGAHARRLRQGMPTAALACFEAAEGWAAIDRTGARLVDFITPKAITKAEE